MIDLGSTQFLLAIPSVSESQLKRLSSSLFDSWEAYVDQHLSLPDYSLFLQVEEGSVKGVGQVAVVLGALYVGIGNYGDFVSGVETINEQVGAVSDYLNQQAGQVFSCPESRASSRKRGGTLAALQGLFGKVQKGDMTPEEATIRAESLLGDESKANPEFLGVLSDALRNCPRHHEQQVFPFLDDSDEPLQESNSSQRKPQTPRSSPTLGPPLLLRVEVWRESKTKRKHTRVINL